MTVSSSSLRFRVLLCDASRRFLFWTMSLGSGCFFDRSLFVCLYFVNLKWECLWCSNENAWDDGIIVIVSRRDSVLSSMRLRANNKLLTTYKTGARYVYLSQQPPFIPHPPSPRSINFNCIFPRANKTHVKHKLFDPFKRLTGHWHKLAHIKGSTS